MSESDTAAGTVWNQAISDNLEQSNYGILCLTPENVDSRWLLFEAGALSKLGNSRVIPLLFDVSRTDIEPPLSQFQMKEPSKSGMFDVLTSLNSGLDKPLETGQLKAIFDAIWPGLDRDLDDANRNTRIQRPRRTDRALLEEILALLRKDSTASDPVTAVGSKSPTRLASATLEIWDALKNLPFSGDNLVQADPKRAIVEVNVSQIQDIALVRKFSDWAADSNVELLVQALPPEEIIKQQEMGRAKGFIQKRR